jgi:hypothetical protein
VARSTPAAHEVDDLQLVSLFERSLGPAISRRDFSIQLDRHTIRLHPKLFDQGSQRKRGRNIAKLPRFPVDLQFHLRNIRWG